MHWTWILVMAMAAGAGAGIIWYLAGRRGDSDSLDGFDFDRAKNGTLLGRDS